jgi:MoaA/NifB/PqqE/SkfB family radical SAM enzyme
MIKWLHLEQTSRCNASCPVCPRNDKGYGLVEGFVEADLDLDRLAQVLDQFPQLETVQYCGYRGDAIAATNFLFSLELVLNKGIRHIQIHTNGSLKTEDWWRNLAVKLKNINHEVWFTLDGLSDTHSVYRQNTDYNKIIANATAFIKSGGTAVWQFIPFKHNQHQLKDVIKTSQKLGFKRIELVKNARYPSSARHYKTGEPIDILPWDKQNNYDRHKGDPFDTYVHTNDHVKIENCMHLSYPSLFLSYEGKLSSCCYYPNSDYLEQDIPKDFSSGQWKDKCLKWCGSKW